MPQPSVEQSVSFWIARLKDGNAEAARRLWERYARRLADLAHARLADLPRRAVDEEDIAQSVFYCLCRGAVAGRFRDITNRDDLWWLLHLITRHKAATLVRRETAAKRGGGRVLSETDLKERMSGPGILRFLHLVRDEPTPEFVAMLDEEYRRLLDLLRDDRLRDIAVWRIEGYTAVEIAARLGIAKRSVERKLRLIRETWAREVPRWATDHATR